MSRFKTGLKRCSLSAPGKPHYFKPLYRNQEACCVQGVKATFWEIWQEEHQNSARPEKVRSES